MILPITKILKRVALLPVISFLLVAVLACCSSGAFGQVIVSGKIFDGEEHVILPGVSVQRLHSQDGLQSDEHGKYYLHANAGDTIRFSFIGYAPRFLVVPKKVDFFTEDIFMLSKELSLPGVTVTGIKNYRKDSIQNRVTNAELFDYQQRSVGSKLAASILEPLGIHQKFNRAHALNTKSRFQDMLIRSEEDNYVDRRYTKDLVNSLTGLQGTSLDQFMKFYRPSYDFIKESTEYDFMSAITAHYRQYVAQGADVSR